MANRIGPMVATLAEARGLTRLELAAKIGVHRNRLSDKIAGRLPFTETEILALAETLGVAPGRLFDDPVSALTAGFESACTARGAGQRHLRLVA
jgi:transcriptional regulator with XRE-family HTH domain